VAGLEVVVRPVIFPDIRPRARHSLPPLDDPEKGICKIGGNPAQATDLSSGWSASSSHSRPKETERRVDDVRVYQKDDDGTVNRDNFIDLQVANRITFDEGAGPSGGESVQPGALPEGTASAERIEFYSPIQEADNIEIKRHNHIIKSDEEAE
jgi:hypothetical protein